MMVTRCIIVSHSAIVLRKIDLRGGCEMKMKLEGTKLWLASEPVDFRKALNGLLALSQNHIEPGVDAVFIFYNRARNKVKLIGYHRDGWVLIYKKLDKKRFTCWDKSGFNPITPEQLSWLLAGLDWVALSEHQDVIYTDFY